MSEAMVFRKAEEKDLDRIMEMVDAAKEYFRQAGIPQWQDGYPNRESFIQDRKNGNSYVLESHGIVVGTMAVIFDGEPDYERIYEGAWKSEEGAEYAAVHRVAVDPDCKGKGLAGFMIKAAEALCREKGVHSIKNDTHRLNYAMQHMVKKNGFEYCGIVYLESGAERLAFEKIIL